jgi:riboflavin synthase
MFTGIVNDVGEVLSVKDDGGRRFVIKTAYDVTGVELGASICCSGACMTVVAKDSDQTRGNSFDIDVSFESLSKTTLGGWKSGTLVNLERSLALGDELGGHLVSGHVDGVGTVTDIQNDGISQRFTFTPPKDLLPLIAQKGSVAIDGVSLTVNEVDESSFGVNLIPHTLFVTSLGQLRPGSSVNIEIDMLARYVARQMEFRNV